MDAEGFPDLRGTMISLSDDNCLINPFYRWISKLFRPTLLSLSLSSILMSQKGVQFTDRQHKANPSEVSEGWSEYPSCP
jgi:hypothetical protein